MIKNKRPNKINQNKNALPTGWIWTKLCNVSFQITDGTHKTPKYQNEGIRFISIKNIKPFQTINWNSYVKFISNEEHNKLLKRCNPEKDDILFPRIGTLGYAKRIDFDTKVSIFVGLGLIKPIRKYILPKYMEYYMNTPSIYNLSHKRATGTGRKTLPLEASRELPFPLSPLNEQYRIVNKIEELFSDLDKGVEQLETVRQQLKTYRQAVLKWAFEGKLTEEWRKIHKTEPANKLLEQIKTEREKRYKKKLEDWRQAVKDWEAKGKPGKNPKQPRKPKQLPPITEAELAELPKLPERWCWVKIDIISEDDQYAIKAGPFGSALKKEYYVQRGYKIYGQEQVISGDHKYGNYYISENKYKELQSCKVKSNDILISLVGTVGKVLVLPRRIEPGIINPRLIKISLNALFYKSNFFKFYFESAFLKSLYKVKAHGATMDILNLSIIYELPFPFCSLKEQHQIVQEIETRLSVCDNIEATIGETLEKAEALRQSILKMAFEGRLVPQDPADEPAEKLLERIKAERAKRDAENKNKRRTKSRKRKIVQ